MSNHLITAAYKADLRTPMRKAVMVLLADKASDDGSGIWASKQTMADELCCSKQAVITTIKAFIAEGLLIEAGHRKSPTGYTNLYSINIDELQGLALVNCWAGKEADRGSMSLTGQPPLPVNEDEGRGQPPLPKPPLTVVDKANALPTKRAKPKAVQFDLPDWIPAEAWDGFVAMRKSINKPMSDRAKVLAIGKLQELADDGHPPGEVLDQSTLSSWLGLFPIKDKQNGHAKPNGGARDRGPDPIVDALARATREAADLERSSANQAGGFGTRHALPPQ